MPSYPYDKQVKIIIATMALHNYIRRYARHDIHFANRSNVQNDIQNEGLNMEGNAQEQHAANEMEAVRNEIATSLMTIHSP